MRYAWIDKILASRGGVEPPTCPLGGGRAIHCATGTNFRFILHTMGYNAIIQSSYLNNKDGWIKNIHDRECLLFATDSLDNGRQ